MSRPNNVDIWDGTDLKRDESLTDEQREKLIQDTLKEAKESAERFVKSQSA